MGDIVGRKLWGLAAEADHQVIVVTHLPQLAALPDELIHAPWEARPVDLAAWVASLANP